MKPIGYRDPMKAKGETYSTTNIKSAGGGYDPQGKKGGYGLVFPSEVAGVSFAPFLKGQDIGSLTEHFYDTGSKIRYKKKAPYNAEYNNVRREPGFYPLGKPGPEGYGNQVERANWKNDEPNVYQYPADLISALGILDRQVSDANMPHQWMRAPIEMDMSQRHIAQFFEDVSSKNLERKIQDLEAKGYSPDEIKDVIMSIRRRDIEKDLSGPSHEHLRYDDIRDRYPSVAPELTTFKRETSVQSAPQVRTRYRVINSSY